MVVPSFRVAMVLIACASQALSTKVETCGVDVEGRSQQCDRQAESEINDASAMFQAHKIARDTERTSHVAVGEELQGARKKLCHNLQEKCPHDSSNCKSWSGWGDSARAKNCCICDGGRTHTLSTTPDQDTFSVLTYNTYLLRVKIVADLDVRPNLGVRSDLTKKWFDTLIQEGEDPLRAVPDVVVLEEIYSQEGEDLIRKLCTDKWRRNSDLFNHPHHKFIECDVPNSPFGYATPNANPTWQFNAIKTSGTMVLLKKGNIIEDAKDTKFVQSGIWEFLKGIFVDDVGCKGDECFTQLGHWAVSFFKGTQKYWFFGTHVTAWPQNREVRQKQFKLIREYIDDNVEDGARLAIAGDMNIFTNPFSIAAEEGVHSTKEGVTHTAEDLKKPPLNEENRMLESLGDEDRKKPAIGGTHVPKGFWLPLDEAMSNSADPDKNHFLSHIPDEKLLAAQRYDWVVAPSEGDRLQAPRHMRYQIVPVKSDTCYKSAQPGAGTDEMADDLSDHYGVFAELRYTDDAPEVAVVQGHRGSGTTLPAGPSCV